MKQCDRKQFKKMEAIESDVLHISFIEFDGPYISGPPHGPSYESQKAGAHVSISFPLFHASGTGQLSSSFLFAFLIVFFHMELIVRTECFLSQYPLKSGWRTIFV